MDFKKAPTESEFKETSGKKATLASTTADTKAAEQQRYYEGRTSGREQGRTQFYYVEDRETASYGVDVLRHRGRKRNEMPTGYVPKIDEKKERWKREGRKNWKHARKAEYDRKQSTEEYTAPLRPVVADALRGVGFDETHYLSPEMLLLSLYWTSDPSVDGGLRACIEDLYREEKQAPISDQEFGDAAEVVIGRRYSDILERCPEVRERVTETGNCGEMANFLFEKTDEETAEHSNFDTFIEELRQNVRVDKVKLINVQANIGHAFTLICYEQDGRTVVELIQAWQDEYSVKKSLYGSGREIYTNQELADMFSVMHRGLTQKKGARLYDAVFLGVKLKDGIDRFEVDRMIVKTINETPESYAERIAEKEWTEDKKRCLNKE